jgi:hypothetical protein
LVWSLNPSRVYLPKLGYKALVEEGREDQHVWWWKVLWKLKSPSKSKIFMWLILNNRAPTWDILQKKIILLDLVGAVYANK